MRRTGRSRRSGPQTRRLHASWWDRLLTAYNAVLPRLDTDPAFPAAREALLKFGREVREQPGANAVLRRQGEVFGMGERPNLARMLADARPERVVGGLVGAAKAGTRARLQELAAQEAARRQALEVRQSRSMGM